MTAERGLRTQALDQIPDGVGGLRGGKPTRLEWAHVIGLFQALAYPYVCVGGSWVDLGCGTGLLANAALQLGAEYVGLDVSRQDVEFCQRHYTGPVRFEHLDQHNATYAPGQPKAHAHWPVASGLADIVTALSVFTHLSYADAQHALAEAARVLKPGGVLLATWFNAERTPDPAGRHHTSVKGWQFTEPGSRALGSPDWRAPAGTGTPENVVGIRPAAWFGELQLAGFDLLADYPGTWAGSGLYFQDITIARKVGRR